MAIALEEAGDLIAIAVVLLLIALLYALKWTITPLLSALHSALKWVPGLGNLTNKVENAIIGSINAGIGGLEYVVVDLFHGLIWSFDTTITGMKDLATYTRRALAYLWSTALGQYVTAATRDIRTTARQAATDVANLTGTVITDVRRLGDAITQAELDAIKIAANTAGNLVHAARADITQAYQAADAEVRAFASDVLQRAERYTDAAVSGLAAAENAAIAEAKRIAAAGTAAAESEATSLFRQAEAAATAAATAAEQAAASDFAKAEAEARALVAAAEANASAALTSVRNVAIDAQHDLGIIEGQYGALGVAGLIASIPAIGTLVETIARESGLENQSCRTKVKGICQTDPDAWASLLEGLAVLGFGLSLAEMANVARPLIGGLADVVREAA